MPRDKHPQTTWTSPNALGQFQLNRDYQEWIKESNHVSIWWVIRAAGDWFALSPPMNFEGCPTHRNFGNWPLIDHHKHLSNDPTLKRRAAGTKDPDNFFSLAVLLLRALRLLHFRRPEVLTSQFQPCRRPRSPPARLSAPPLRMSSPASTPSTCTSEYVATPENSSNTGASFVCQD